MRRTTSRRGCDPARGPALRDRAPGARPSTRLGLLSLFALVSLLSLSAMGSKEIPLAPVTGLENWEHVLDLSGLKPGKHNVVVEAVDAAGNKAVGGPINIYADPASDLPLVSIVNPYPAMRVGGDLVVVGTALDDDGVAGVEVAVDDGPFQKADGAGFWSFSLATKPLADGRRTISARALDLNGLAGPPTKVAFDLDRAKPLVEPSFPQAGALVAGRLVLRGSVYDLNVPKRLELSLDGGSTYSALKLRPLERSGVRQGFEQALDTAKFPDGPLVLRFRATDGVGSTATHAHLVYVDNTKPTIQIALPAKGESVNGRFALAGAARDAVGIKSLRYQAGELGGEIVLAPGDPYFFLELDAGASKGELFDLSLRAEDSIGNVTLLKYPVRIDRKADRPVLSLLGPEPGAWLPAGTLVRGSIRDDDGVSALRWSIDGAPASELACSESFVFALPPLPSGKHLLALTPVDSNGLAGDAVSLAFSADAGPPEILADSLIGKAGSRPWAPGLEVRVDGGELLEGRILAPNPPVAASYAISGGAQKALTLAKGAAPGEFRFSLPLDRSLPYGAAILELSVRDVAGREARSLLSLYVANYAAAREDTGFRVADARVPAPSGDGPPLVLFGAPPQGGASAQGGAVEPIRWAFYRETLVEARLEPPTPLLELRREGQVLILSPAAEGRSAPTKLVVRTDRGREYSAGPYRFDTDVQPPELVLSGPAAGTWLKEPFALAGRARDGGGLSALSYRRLPDGPTLEIALASDGSFSLPLDPKAFPQGLSSFEFEARDLSGNVVRSLLNLGLDAEPPRLEFLSPEAEAEVWGPEDIAGRMEDPAGIALVEFAEDGTEFRPIDAVGGFFVHRADLAASPRASYRVTDRAGNTTVARPSVRVAPPPARPALAETLEVASAAGEPRFALAGVAGAGRKLALGLPGLRDLDYAALGFAEGGPRPERFPSMLLLSGKVALKGQVDVPATPVAESTPAPDSIPAVFEAPAGADPGAASTEAAAPQEASPSPPAPAPAAPALVKQVSLSLDGGATYQVLAAYKDTKSAKPVLPFSLNLDTAGLAQGEYRLLLKVEDFAGAAYFSPIYAWIDNAPPSLVQIYPRPDSPNPPSWTGPLPLVFRLSDDSGPLAAALALGAEKLPAEPLSVGRYLARLADPGAPKASPLAAALSARDGAGNQAALVAKLLYDAAGDKPRLELRAPPAGELLEAGARFVATASDDDGPPALSLSLDGAPVAESSLGGLAFVLPELSPGQHAIRVSVRDPAGLETVKNHVFAVKGRAPSIQTPEIGDAESRRPLGTGLALELPAKPVIAGLVHAPNGLAALELRIVGQKPVPALLGKAGGPGAPVPYLVSLPPGLPYERIELELRARDSLGLETLWRGEFHNLLSSPLPIEDADGILLVDARLQAEVATTAGAPAAGAAEAGGLTTLLSPGDRLRGRFKGRPLASLALDPPLPGVELAVDGQFFTLAAAAEALHPAATLRAVTIDGDRFSWGPFRLRVDAAPPRAAFTRPAPHDWVQGAVRVEGSLSDPNGLATAALRVNGGGSFPLALAAAAEGARSFAFDLPLGAAPDGTVLLELLAVDGAGRESLLPLVLNKDTLAPRLSQVLPGAGDAANGTTTLVFLAEDSGRLASADFRLAKGRDPSPVSGLSRFSASLDLSRTALPLAEGGGFLVRDRAGNESLLAPDLKVDAELDKPVVSIEAPEELEVIRAPVQLAGVIYDDDRVARAEYRLDGGEWRELAMSGTAFSLPLVPDELGDNEHLLELHAEDHYGLRSEVASRRVRVSREEPRGFMRSPPLDRPVRGSVLVAGEASDANGVAGLRLSFDNRRSFERAVGTEAWEYRLDTPSLPDGLHAVGIATRDAYGTEGFDASIVTVDNTAPFVTLDLPTDGARVARELLVAGRAKDSGGLESLVLELLPVGRETPVFTRSLAGDSVVRVQVPLEGIPAGAYSVRLVAVDRAGNQALASCDIDLIGLLPEDRVDIAFPIEGMAVTGLLRVSGRASVQSGTAPVVLLADGVEVGLADADLLGNFSLDLPPERVEPGRRTLVARTRTPDGRSVDSLPIVVDWSPEGPWVSFETFSFGSYVPERPWLEGRAGWADPSPDPLPDLSSASPKERAEAAAAAKELQAARKPVRVEISFDNGKTFQEAQGAERWKFRLETQDYPEGGLYLIVKASFAGGATALAKTLLFLDKTPPELVVERPVENGRYNAGLRLSGTASDANGLRSVAVGTRVGDKNSYEVPSFIQGLYLDGQFLGVTQWSAGGGLTFFQDNVKLQVGIGQTPEFDEAGVQQSFFGSVLSVKLIANLLYLPFNTFFGPDWEFLSTSLGVGANFSYFSGSQSGQALIVGGIFGQVEFPKFSFLRLGAFRKYSTYFEYQLWVLSSVVEGGVIQRASVGVRIGIF